MIFLQDGNNPNRSPVVLDSIGITDSIWIVQTVVCVVVVSAGKSVDGTTLLRPTLSVDLHCMVADSRPLTLAMGK